MTRWFNVDATFRESQIVSIDDDSLNGADLREHVLALVDSSTADLVEYEITEVQNDAT